VVIWDCDVGEGTFGSGDFIVRWGFDGNHNDISVAMKVVPPADGRGIEVVTPRHTSVILVIVILPVDNETEGFSPPEHSLIETEIHRDENQVRL